MKSLLLLALFIPSMALAAPYSKGIVHVLEQLRQIEDIDENLPFIGGCAVGDSGQPGTFYLLIPYISYRASIDDLKAMLGDESPSVRLMAAKILLHSDQYKVEAKEADCLLKDQAKVRLAEFGCSTEAVTVGEVVHRIKSNKGFLGDAKEYGLSADGTITPPLPPETKK